MTVAEWRKIHNHSNQLVGVSDETIEYWFKVAEILFGGDNCIIKDAEQRELAIQLFTCHVITLMQRGTLGTVTSSSEGSVNVSLTVPTNLINKSSLNLTPCGALLWSLMSKYRMGIRWYKGR